MITIVAPEVLTSAVFSIEGDPTAPTFRGLHNEHARWNGWAVPLFTREVVDQVIGMATAWGSDNTLTFAWDGDILVCGDADYPGEEYRQQPYVLDGVLLWDCGFGWVWDTVEDEVPAWVATHSHDGRTYVGRAENCAGH